MGRESELREWKAKLRRDLYVLRLIKGCRRDSAQLKLAELMLVLGHGSPTIVDLNVHASGLSGKSGRSEACMFLSRSLL